MPSLTNVTRLLVAFFYRPRVIYEFPIAVLDNGRKSLGPLPEGYEYRVATEADCAVIASLLSSDPGFGTWTAERVKVELFDRLIDPRAATIMLFKGTPVGCGFVTDASTRRRRIAYGMYLYLMPAHRGKKSVTNCCVFRTFAPAVDLNYDLALGESDLSRLSVLLLHLSNGCVPVKNSLYSYIQWFQIERRLGPTLTALTKRQTRKAIAE